jgi:hypothetical protein
LSYLKVGASKKARFDRGRNGFSKISRRNQRDRLFNEIVCFVDRNRMLRYDLHHVISIVRTMVVNGELGRDSDE